MPISRRRWLAAIFSSLISPIFRTFTSIIRSWFTRTSPTALRTESITIWFTIRIIPMDRAS